MVSAILSILCIIVNIEILIMNVVLLGMVSAQELFERGSIFLKLKILA